MGLLESYNDTLQGPTRKDKWPVGNWAYKKVSMIEWSNINIKAKKCSPFPLIPNNLQTVLGSIILVQEYILF